MIKLACLALAWQLALPGWTYEFPRDHGSHPGFKTEWWYFTGNLRAKDGHEFGYQLTFFRQGVTPPSEAVPATSRFVTRDLKFAHFAITDVTGGKFYFGQLLSRGAFGEAGFSDGARLAWIDDCSLVLLPDGGLHLTGQDAGKSLDLTLHSAKPPAVHGQDGVSQKADGVGHASHYYSFTRMETSGTLRVGGSSFDVDGLSWFDHEWASNQLAKNQIGWDWFSLQFDDGCELMLFELRTKQGIRDHWSGGSWIAADGQITRISNDDFTLDPSDHWKSSLTGGTYPTRWRLRISKLAIDVEVAARMDDQELCLPAMAYWEGAVETKGSCDGSPVRGKGYLEMTGYAGPLTGLQSGD